MQYWLLKTEPEEYSIDDLKEDGVGQWEGVRNFAARNNLKGMKKGDLALFYHSSIKPAGIVGLAEVVKEAYPDFTAWDPGSHYYDPRSSKDKPLWFMVDVKFVEKFPRLLTLAEIKAHPFLRDMVLVKRGRLSVQPVDKKHFEVIQDLVRN